MFGFFGFFAQIHGLAGRNRVEEIVHGDAGALCGGYCFQLAIDQLVAAIACSIDKHRQDAYFQPQISDSRFVTTMTLLTVLIDAKASPRKPKV